MHFLIFFSLVLKEVTHSNYILNTSRLSLFEFVIVWFVLVWFDLIQFHFGLCVDFRVRLVLRESKSMVFLCYFIFIRLYYFIFLLIRIGTSLTFDFILQECCGATIRAYFLPFKPFLEILSLGPKCKQNQNSTVTPWSRLLVKAQTSENWEWFVRLCMSFASFTSQQECETNVNTCTPPPYALFMLHM